MLLEKLQQTHPFSTLAKAVLILLFISNGPLVLSAQQCIPAAPVCSEAIAMCENFVSFTLPDETNNSGVIPGCNGNTTFDNTVWYVFTAQSNFISINISAGACTTGQGFQTGLYTDCDFNAPILGLQCACTTAPVNFSGPVNPWQQYFIMVNGCSGDVCDMNISVTQGAIVDCFEIVPSPPNPPTADNNPVCPGLIVELTTDPVDGAIAYDWNFPAGVTPISLDCNTATVQWGFNSGNVTVTAYFQNLPYGLTSQPTFVQMTEPTGYEFGEYCSPDDPGYLHLFTGTLYQAGTYEIVLPFGSALGCDSTVILEVTERTSEPGFINMELCPGDSTDINGQVYTDAGFYEQHFPDGSAFGCDSTLFIFIFSGDFEIRNKVTTDAGCGKCNGTLSFDINCGYSPLEILWSDSLANGQTAFDSLCAGTYTVTIVDDEGFILTEEFVIGGGSGLTIASNSNNISCFGAMDASITTDVQGGAGNITYDWSNDTYDGEQNLDNIGPGTYELTVTDEDGCSGSISIEITEPAELTLSLTAEDITCNSLGSISANVNGGTGNYTYEWSNGANSSDIDNLGIGTYALVVTDENGCEVQSMATINTPLILNGEPVNTFESGLPANDTLNCGELSIFLEANGYNNTEFVWTTNDGNILLTDDNLVELNEGGTYYLQMSITVNGVVVCSLIDSVEIFKECCPVEFHIESTDETCLGIDDGTASVVIDGMGLPPYTYEWSDPDLPSEANVTGLAPGTYTITLTDAAGCSDDISFEIDAYLDINLTITPAACDGTGGAATASAGGFFIYYSWSNGGTGQTQTNLDVGEYTVRAWSIFGGCQSQKTFTIGLEDGCNDASNEVLEATVLKEDADTDLNTLRFNAPVGNTQLSGIRLMPNPIQGRGQVEISLPSNDQIQLMIFNAEGKLVQQIQSAAIKGVNRFDVDLGNRPAGLYMVQIKSSTGISEVMKWMKTH